MYDSNSSPEHLGSTLCLWSSNIDARVRRVRLVFACRVVCRLCWSSTHNGVDFCSAMVITGIGVPAVCRHCECHTILTIGTLTCTSIACTLPVKMSWKARSTFVESSAEVSMNDRPCLSANERACSAGTARRCLRSFLFPTWTCLPSRMVQGWGSTTGTILHGRDSLSLKKAYQHDNNMAVSMIPKFFQPALHIFVCNMLRDIVDQQCTHSATVVPTHPADMRCRGRPVNVGSDWRCLPIGGVDCQEVVGLTRR